MPLEPTVLVELVLVGLVAGLTGGLLGLGGAIVIIPALTILLHTDHHLAQAAAMIVNVFVALFAFLRHHREAAVRWDVVARMVPAGVLFISAGVAVSDRVPGPILRKVFGVFLLWLISISAVRLYRSHRRRVEAAPPPERVDWPHAGLVGGSTGFVAGLLGIGGGPIAVPLLRRVCRMPLRECIAASSAAIFMTSLVGAAQKNAGLAGLTGATGLGEGLHVTDSFLLAACLAPTAVLGAFVGAGLTHRLPLDGVRVAFIAIMSWACVQMLT